MGPLPETDLPEAKQLRLCLLSKSGLRNQDKSQKPKDSSDGFEELRLCLLSKSGSRFLDKSQKEAELSSDGKRGRVLGPVVGAYGEMFDDVYVPAEAVAEELATEHCGFYSDKK